MNAVEIEQAISELALEPFNASEFPFSFLAAFGHKETTLKRLRTGNNNASDLPNGVLLRNHIHIAVCETGAVGETFTALKASPFTTKAKAKFILATDGQTLEAEELASGEIISPSYQDFPDHFGFFLPLAGISTIKEIKDNPIDVRATGRLNKLYVELLRENPDWATDERRVDMNHFMARLIFCFFAEDTDIFNGYGSFTKTVEQMSERDGSNTHEVLSEIFRAMNTPTRHEGKLDNRHRKAANIRIWADKFPYVNGGLFSGSTDVPRFTRMARTYFLHAGGLNWKEINPDIFGSMIQAVADDSERGALGMHYTNVPNILKVLNPLFLDDLRAQLAEAGNNKIKLLNLRRRMARIRVFDPACGSGNFLVIAYKQMREIEAEINRRREESHLGSAIPLTNFRGIELRDFPAEIARLALIIAEFQCDVLYRGQKDALAEFLPLDAQNWIVCHNALRLDWLSVCPPEGMGVKLVADDLFNTPLNQVEIDFQNEGGETYICGNPPYKGSQDQTSLQKADLLAAFDGTGVNAGSADYVLGWFSKASAYIRKTEARYAFVATNSIHQGRQVAKFWPPILGEDLHIFFAEPSFKWANLASKKAVVTVSIIGVAKRSTRRCKIISSGMSREVDFIGPYLVANCSVVVEERKQALSALAQMNFGSMPNDGGGLLLSHMEADKAIAIYDVNPDFLHPASGTEEFINGISRKCIWVSDTDYERAKQNNYLSRRFKAVEEKRARSTRPATAKLSSVPYRFGEVRQRGDETVLIVSKTSSENREFIPATLLPKGHIVTEAFGIYDASLWYMSIVVSRLHLVWATTVCGKLETRYRYSNTLGWNTFPLPLLTEQNKTDLTVCAEEILLAREAHFPATIADLYEPDNMPDNLRYAHERNDEVLERIYIGRRFKNDTERLEKLFDLYTKMTAAAPQKAPVKKTVKRKKA